MLDMWRQLKITKLTFITLRQSILLHMYFPTSWNTHFRLHCRISSASIVSTNPCLSLTHITVLHWKFILTPIQSLLGILTTGLFRIYLKVWDGFIWKFDSELFSTRALRLEAWTVNSLSFTPIFCFTFILNQFDYSPWPVLEDIAFAFITLSTNC